MHHCRAHRVGGCSVGRSDLIQHVLTGVCGQVPLQYKFALWRRTLEYKTDILLVLAKHTHWSHLPRWKQWLTTLTPLEALLSAIVAIYRINSQQKACQCVVYACVMHVFMFYTCLFLHCIILQVFMFTFYIWRGMWISEVHTWRLSVTLWQDLCN